MSITGVGVNNSCSMASWKLHHITTRSLVTTFLCVAILVVISSPLILHLTDVLHQALRSTASATHTMQDSRVMKPRSSRRLFATLTADSTPTTTATSTTDAATQLVLPSDCELIAGTFVVFTWENNCCILQVNATLYCWGRRRSGAIEHVLDNYGLSQSAQLHRVNSKLVSGTQWSWLKQIFVVVHRLFDDSEMCESVAKVRWINIMQCGMAYEVMRRECYRYHRNLYPKGSVLTSFLKRRGVEVEPWYDGHMSSTSSDSADEDSRSAHPVARSSLSSPSSPSSSSNTIAATDGGAVRTITSTADDARGSGSGTSTSPRRRASAVPVVWGDREWLSDVHIANVIFLLLHGQLVVPLEHRDLFQCVYPLTDQLLEHMLYRPDPGSLLMHAKVDRGITLAFVNPNSNHWRLVVFDGLHQQVVMFDPLGVSFPALLSRAIRDFVGPAYRVTDIQTCLQAEGWNCGIWALYAASRYVSAVCDRLSCRNNNNNNDTDPAMPPVAPFIDAHESYAVLTADSTSWQRYQNRTFAAELRTQYATLLAAAQVEGRLLYTTDEEDNEGVLTDNATTTNNNNNESNNDGRALCDSPRRTLTQPAEANISSIVVRAGSAFSVVRHRRFIDRPLAELLWIDLTDGVGAVEVEQEEEVEASFDDLCDQFIEFREDNLTNTCAAALRYSLPSQLQSDVLKQQIDDFRAYRRQRFSLFRKGPLVEETTISSNVSALLRFLGYLHYEHASVVVVVENGVESGGAALDMSVFALSNINMLVLEYVQWLERRRGSKARASDDTSFQPVSCATVANYLNGLVSIVKYQLRHELHLRDPLLEQLRNLRSQADSYSMAQKKFEKVHPQWCSWAELQTAREKCRSILDQQVSADEPGNDASCLLHLRELCLLGFFTICPPPRCSIVRLLEWNKTLVREGTSGRWVIDLTDLSHAATRHKTHKHKGAMLLPLPKCLYPYLALLRQRTPRGDGPVFPASRRAAAAASSSSLCCMGPAVFTSFVKTTFSKYTESGKGPNPSLLRSIFTTWLYGLRYDTEDTFLQEIKASSAKWKAHSEQMAATVYNKDVIYQHKVFAQLLLFCETYSERYSYDRPPAAAPSSSEGEQTEMLSDRRRRRSSKKRSREDVVHDSDAAGRDEYVVEALLDVRVNKLGEKQVRVKWEGYHRTTWEPYESMRQQLPDMLAQLENGLAHADDDDDKEEKEEKDVEESAVHAFLLQYIATHRVGRGYRWWPDRLNTLELAAEGIKQTGAQLRRKMMRLVSERCGAE